MKIVISLMALPMFPLAALVVAFQVAKAFIEDRIM